MAETLTTLLKTDTVRMFHKDLQDNNYYVFVSSISVDSQNQVAVENSIKSKNLFLDKAIFGKKIQNDDCKFMVKYYPWQDGQTFEQYDDAITLEGERFYCVVGPNINKTGDYRVYKCLYNYNGASVSTAPEYDPSNESQIYPVADGYIWKYMYKLTQAEFEAYNAVGYMPIVGDFELNPFDETVTPTDANTYPISTTYGSEINQIFVENVEENAGYPKATGKINSTAGNDGTLTLVGSLEFPLNEIDNYYSGMSVVLTDSQGKTYIYTCSTYEYNEDKTDPITGDPVEWEAKIQLSDGDDPYTDMVKTINGVTSRTSNGSSFQILPRIEISGDGVGAQAYPVVKNGIITSIQVTDPGSGYNRVEAEVVDPLYDFNPTDKNSVDIRATIRPILSPAGGHNTDILEELGCRHVLLYGYITESDNLKIGGTNTYSHLGIVKSPEWQSANTDTHNPDVFDNRIAIVTNDYASVEVDKLLIQVNSDNETTFSAKVHEVDESANTVYLYDYNGIYRSTANNDLAFDYDIDFLNESGVTISINTPVEDNVTESPLTQRSGLVYFMENFAPIERTSESREEYKLLLEF